MNLTQQFDVAFYARLVAVSRYAGLFDEADHPRDSSGEFTRKGSGSSGGSTATGPKKPTKKPAAAQGALFQGNVQGSLFDKAPKVGSLGGHFNDHFNSHVKNPREREYSDQELSHREAARVFNEIVDDPLRASHRDLQVAAGFVRGEIRHEQRRFERGEITKQQRDDLVSSLQREVDGFDWLIKDHINGRRVPPADDMSRAEKIAEAIHIDGGNAWEVGKSMGLTRFEIQGLIPEIQQHFKAAREMLISPARARAQARQITINQTAGKVPGTVAPVDELIPEPVKPLAGQKSMFHLRDAILRELYARGEITAVERYRESDPADGKWITIGGGEHGKGTHVKVKGGKIVTGPPAITGKKLEELPDRGGNGGADTKEAAKPKPLPGWKEFQLKSEPAERPNPNKAKQQELALKQGRRVGPGLEHVHDLHVDPERFQYKINVSGKKGVTGQFSDIKFNPEFAGTLHVWHDTENGKTYVVNGHHRHELAERSGYAGKLQVHYLDAANAEEARAKGALINIAGGNGTAVDAAKFMRDTGTTADELRDHGVSLKGQVAKDAAVLSSLSPGIFRRLALGTYRMGRALAIAQHLPEHVDQDRLDHWIDRYEETKNRELSDSTVEEMAREAAQSARQQQTTKGLFGEETEDRSLFVERAELKGALRRDITGRLNKFRAVSTDKSAATLEGANQINAAENKKTADRLANFLDDFDRETSFKGPVSDRLNQASQELANAPGKRKTILERLNADIRTILETVPENEPVGTGGDDRGSGGTGSDGGIEDAGKQYAPAAGQKGFFARQFDGEFERAVYGRVRLIEERDREAVEAFRTERYQWKESDHPRAADGRFGPGATHTIPAHGTRMELKTKFFPGKKDGEIGVGWHDSDSPSAFMPSESARHFVNDLSGKVDVPANSGDPVIDAIASGKAKLLGKGDDGIVFGVGDKVAKVSTTVPFQPFNPGHRSPQEAVSRLEDQVKVNNLLADKGIPGVMRQMLVKHGDKAFAIRDMLEMPDKLTPTQLQKVRRSVDQIHEAGYVVGDQIQVGTRNGEPYLFDLGKAQKARDHEDYADDSDNFERFAEKMGGERLPLLTHAKRVLQSHDEDAAFWSEKGKSPPGFDKFGEKMRRGVEQSEMAKREQFQLREVFDRAFYAAITWQESKHHRGQPDNAGQFGPGGGGHEPPKPGPLPADGSKPKIGSGNLAKFNGKPGYAEHVAERTTDIRASAVHDQTIGLPSTAYTPANASGLDTQQRFKTEQGYTHERTALHHAILGKMANGVKRSTQPTVFMTGGGPASGKGTLLKAGLIAEPENAMHIDADEIKKGLPEYREMTKSKDIAAAGFAHEESADVSQMAIAHAAKNQFDAVYDSTGDSGLEKLAKKVNQMRAGGHRIVAHYVTVDVEEALRRAVERGKKTGRVVDPQVVRGIHAGVSSVLPQAINAGLFDEMTLWDTNEGTPRKVVSSIGKNLTVHDHGLWQAFIDKAKG